MAEAKLRRDGLYYILESNRIEGSRPEMRGRIRNLWGDCSQLSGDCSGLKGNCTGVIGDASGIRGDLEECAITEAERLAGIEIDTLIRAGNTLR